MKQNLGIMFRALAVSVTLVLLPLAASGFGPRVPLIELNATGSAAEMGRGTSMAANDAANKMMMPNPFTYTYAAGEKLSDKAGNGKVYKVVIDGDPKAVLTKLAKVFGITGNVFEPEYSQPEYPTFQIGSKDGSGPSVTINGSGTGNWWFNDPSAYPSSKCKDWATADDGSDYCIVYEEQKATPGLIPSKDKVIAAAIEMFNATGLKVSASDIRVDVSDWGASASASLKIDGADTPIEWYMSWGSNGKLGSVSGNSVRFEEKGTLGTISEKASVARMSDWRYSGQVASSVWNKYAPPVRAGEPGAIAYDAPLEVGESPQPEVTPKPIVVTVNEAHAISVLIWDKNGNAWLVPGYVLIGDQGWLTPVFALEDGVVALPDPVAIEPRIDDSVSTEPGQSGEVSPMVK
jgi:hypothetical protein